MQTISIIMKPFTVVTLYSQELFFEKTLLFLTKSDLVERVVIVSQEPVHLKMAQVSCSCLRASSLIRNTQPDSGWNPNEVSTSLARDPTNFYRA